MKIVCCGSCQTEVVSKVLRNKYKVSSFQIYNIASYEELIEQVKLAEIFIHQNFVTSNPKNFHLQYSQIKNHINKDCKVVSFPFIEFRGYFPDLGVDERNKKTITEELKWGLFPTGTEYFASSSSYEEIMQKLTQNYYSKEFMEKLVNEYLEKIKKREKETNIKVAEFIEENYKKERLFFNHLHFSNSLLNHILKQLCEIIKEEIIQVEEEDQLMGWTIMPIPDSVFKSLQLSFPEGPCRYSKGNLCSREEYVRKYCEVFNLKN